MKNETIETLRHSLELSKKEFAVELGITQTSYTNYIQGKREIPSSLAIKMKDKYQISIDWLLSGTGSMLLNEHDQLLHEIAVCSNALDNNVAGIDIDDTNTAKLIQLLKYAPPQFITNVINKLEEFKKLSSI